MLNPRCLLCLVYEEYRAGVNSQNTCKGSGWHWMHQVVFLSSKVLILIASKVLLLLLAIKVMSNVLFASKVFLVSKGFAEMVSVFKTEMGRCRL